MGAGKITQRERALFSELMSAIKRGEETLLNIPIDSEFK